MTPAEDLLQKIESHRATVAVVGLGYVGLPAAVRFAETGFPTLGFDVKEEVVESVNSGSSHVMDVPSEDLDGLVEGDRLEATTDFRRLAEADAVVICVPTPLSKTGDPDVSFIVSALDEVAARLRRGQLVILESTTYPGTTRELVLERLADTGMEAGEDFFLAFSPERIDPGNREWTLENTPKVVGGLTERCHRLAATLYDQIIDEVVEVSSPEAAELTKILENTFRAVNIALANEMALIADRLGIDIWEVIDAAATKPYGFMRFHPGPGLGGHCIPVDPHYLAWKMKTLQYRTRFIELASEVNAEMPRHVVTKVTEALNREEKPVNGSRILLLGVSYKPDVDDIRESPALDVIQLLEAKGGDVAYHDPHVPAVGLDGREHRSVPLDAETLEAQDVVVVTTDHGAIDYDLVMEHAGTIVDSRNVLAGRDGPATVYPLAGPPAKENGRRHPAGAEVAGGRPEGTGVAARTP